MTIPPAPLDPSNDPSLRSWIESANDPATDFPPQNLPLCMFRRGDLPDEVDPNVPRAGMGIGDSIVDIDLLMHAGFFSDQDEDLVQRLHRALHIPVLNALCREGPEVRAFVRRVIQSFIVEGHVGQQGKRLRQKAVVRQESVRFSTPVMVGNYTDFYASIHHARTVGSMFRPDNPLLPNYTHVPIGYHGRASSVILSGSDVRRPSGQTNTDNAPAPAFGPSKRLDYELEVGCVIGEGNRLGDAIDVSEASDHVFGYCLVNDWSARDMQAWEYQPLGPFLAKNFATTISPWIVTPEALAPFRVAGPERAATDPEPLPYLRDPHAASAGLDLGLEVRLQSAKMREQGVAPVVISRGNFRHMFWTFSQMIAHHTVNGCNLMPGDLLASGTVSGPTPESRGCLLELTWQGTGPDGKPLPRKPIELPTGEKRTFLEDGDRVTLTGTCRRDGLRRIGFGECTGTVLPARG